MIAKLRKKFIITAMLAVFALLTVILLVINFVNFSMVSDEADRVLDKIVQEGGAFGEGFRPDQTMQSGNPRPIGPNSPELRQTTRYFTVNFDSTGNPVGVELRMSAVNQEEAISWASDLLDNKGGWTRTYYRYRVWSNEAGTHVTIIDQNRELSPSYRVLIASLVGEAVGMVVTLLALIGISKVVVTPIEQSDRRQKRFIRDAAYEIKNPITVIDANRHMLDERLGVSEETQAIDKQIKHLTRLVKGLDELLMLEDGLGRSNNSPFDLSALTEEVVGAYQPLFAQADKRLEVDVDKLPLYTGDSLQIGELMGICLDNALLYSDAYAKLSLRGQGDRIVLTIANDAKGIEDGPLDSVFERFLRGEEAKAAGIEGTGIQLSVAKEIVRRHGGRIMAEGKAGEFVLKIEL